MKKITYILFSFLLIVNYSYGQGEVEALQFSKNDLYGTARSMSMGGAFGALGGDLTGVAINPAGIAVYRSSEVSGTAVFSNQSFKAGDITNSKNTFNLDNLGFVGYFPTRNNFIPLVNFGFSYNKVKSFDRKIGAFGANRDASLLDIMALEGNGYNPSVLNFDSNDDKYDPFNSGAPWLPVLGSNSRLIKPTIENGKYIYDPLHNEQVDNSLYLSERGAINNYEFTVGTTLGNTLNIGVALSLSDIRYNLYSENDEDFAAGGSSGFDLTNDLISEGNGVGVKVGLIYRPVNAFRFGLSYHSPTWYSMTDIYSAIIVSDLTGYETTGDLNIETKSAEFRNDYNFKTPDKWTASAAAILGQNIILSVDYELTNYKSMSFSEPSGSEYTSEFYDNGPNSYIKSDFKSSSTVRAGMEYRFTPQFSGRVGYAWMQNPYNDIFREKGKAVTVGSTTAYRMEGEANHFTAGLGYRFNRNFYADVAFVYKTQEDDLYSFSNIYDESRTNLIIESVPYKLTNNNYRGVLTVGYRF